MTTTARLTLSIAGILALLAVLSVPAQTQDQRVPAIRTTTRLVQLNVVVLDNHRRPVSDLVQDDFEVFDNGREQKLTHFTASSDVVFEPRPAPMPLVVTNRPQGQAKASVSMTVILVDELVEQDVFATEARATMQSARLQVLKFLGTLQPGDHVALYALRPEGVVVVHDFSDDPTELLAAAETLGSGLLRGATPGSADIRPSANIGRPAPAQEIRGWQGRAVR